MKGLNLAKLLFGLVFFVVWPLASIALFWLSFTSGLWPGLGEFVLGFIIGLVWVFFVLGLLLN